MVAALAAVGDVALTVQLEAETNTAAQPPAAFRGRPSSPTLNTARYAMGSELGRGGMGEVLAAKDIQIGRAVAIKRLHAEHPSSEQISRFLREARIQGRLEHPSIPPVHEIAFGDDGKPFFVMKKLSGVTLADVLKRSRAEQLPRVRLLRAFVDVCNAIELAHSRRIVHRDLKPSNILLGEFGEVYVLDWGIARELDAPEQSASVIGTPGYMAPEQVRNEQDLDGRCDVYALGCVLYEILTGQRLHPRGLDMNASTLAGVIARPSQVVDDIAPELDDICLRATMLDRGLRIGSARELGEAVQRYLDGDRDVARRRELASTHLQAAHDALTRLGDDDETRRRNAVREAGRALALDPTLTGAAELVSRIMLEPPAVTPQPVEAELRHLDDELAQQQARFARGTALGFLASTPVFYFMGLKDGLYLGAWAALTTLMLVFAQIGTRTTLRWFSGCTIAATLALIALFSRMFSPFLIAPGVAAVALSAIAMHPVARSRRAVIAITLLAIGVVLGPWVAEALGIASTTVVKNGHNLMITSPVKGTENFASIPALCAYVIALLGISAAIAHAAAVAAHASRRQVHTQAWHLRQLL